jgi:hypothetical protein
MAKNSYHSSTHKAASDFFGVTVQALNQWFRAGCPKNVDGTVNWQHIHKWLIDREKGKGSTSGDLKEQKLKKEIERMEAQINKINSEYVERTTYDSHIRALVQAVNNHGREMARKNYPEFIGLSADEAKIKLLEIFKFQGDLLAGNV